MNKSIRRLIILGIVVVVIASVRPFFVLPEGQQAVVTRFGRITSVHTQAGLKLKLPLVDQVIRYSSKILSWDGDPQRLPTSENQFIWVDTTARWKIVDPAMFYQRVTVMDQAYSRLDNVIESAVRTVVSTYPLSESVRSTNSILESENALAGFQRDVRADVTAANSTADTLIAGDEAAALVPDAEGDADTVQDSEQAVGSGQTAISEQAASEDEAGINDLLATAFAPISSGREALSDEMLTRAQGSMPEYGIELLDVVIRQIRYSDDLTQSVYDRMISERNKVATGYRSDGNGIKAEWLGRLNRDRDIKLSEADREADLTRADGDAQAARIYSSAYSEDPEFYSFWKALESYEQTLIGQDKVLSTNLDFFRYLHDVNGQ